MGELMPHLHECASWGRILAYARADPRLQRTVSELVKIGGARGRCGMSEVSHTIGIGVAELVRQILALALRKRLNESQSLYMSRVISASGAFPSPKGEN